MNIGVKCPGDATVTNLPRQALTPAPYALALPGLYTQQNVTTLSRNQRLRLLAALVVAVLALLTLNVRSGDAATGSAAPSAVGYEIAWNTLDGGGGQALMNGAYTLSGTSGQFDAGALNQTTYAVSGGYWVEIFGYQIFLPMIRR